MSLETLESLQHLCVAGVLLDSQYGSWSFGKDVTTVVIDMRQGPHLHLRKAPTHPFFARADMVFYVESADRRTENIKQFSSIEERILGRSVVHFLLKHGLTQGHVCDGIRESFYMPESSIERIPILSINLTERVTASTFRSASNGRDWWGQMWHDARQFINASEAEILAAIPEIEYHRSYQCVTDGAWVQIVVKDERIALIASLNSQWNMTWSDRHVQETISYATHIAPIFKHCFLPIEEALKKLNDFLQCRSLDGFVSYKHAIATNKIELNLWDEETRLET